MELISQHKKAIMEECKKRAAASGLKIKGETLEYIVTNKDLLQLSPKIMIPTLYDYWVHDVQVLQEKGKYEVYPSNPYETVINTRPAISFYNDNNADWLNVMIFYHVLGHIDFFQNNVFFKNTWNEDFCGKALSDKRMIARLREDMGPNKRRVDYVIEFARAIDNLVGYYSELEEDELSLGFSKKTDFYFGEFLRKKKISRLAYDEEMKRYNELILEFGEKQGEEIFFGDFSFVRRFPEFQSVFEKYEEKRGERKNIKDIMQYLMEHSEFLNKSKNKWMNKVINVVRDTSLIFQPQIRTKTINEGWASYWHRKLFMSDDRVTGHEVEFARVDAGVLAIPRVGFNPYGVGLKLLEFIRDMADAGKLDHEFQLIQNSQQRKNYDKKTGKGNGFLFHMRENFNDFMLTNFLSKDDFQDFVDKNRLFVADRRPNLQTRKWEYFVKSRNGEDYRKMLLKRLYHPPLIKIREEKMDDGCIYIDHEFEGRPLVTEWIPAVLTAISRLWGNTVKLETTEFKVGKNDNPLASGWLLRGAASAKPEIKKVRVVYSMNVRGKLKREER